MPPCAEPDVANCAACATFSPSTRRPRTDFHTPAEDNASCAARPYGACSGFAIANLRRRPSAHGGADVAQCRVELQRRPFRHDEREPADRVRDAVIDRVAFPGEREHVRFVGGQEELERPTLRDLAAEIAGRPIDDAHCAAGFALERGSDLGQRELQVCRGRNERPVGGGCSGRRDAKHGECENARRQRARNDSKQGAQEHQPQSAKPRRRMQVPAAGPGLVGF